MMKSTNCYKICPLVRFGPKSTSGLFVLIEINLKSHFVRMSSASFVSSSLSFKIKFNEEVKIVNSDFSEIEPKINIKNINQKSRYGTSSE